MALFTGQDGGVIDVQNTECIHQFFNVPHTDSTVIILT